MSLARIIGQDAAVAALRSGIARDAVPQAYLFVGPDSVGKTAAAIEFAKAVNCKRRVMAPPAPNNGGASTGASFDDACDGCANCTRIAENQHPDVVRITPEADMTRMWQLWTRPGHPPGALETLPFAPIAAPRRFYIFDKAETLNEEAANSFLKALEEPPPYVNFVLCAPSPTSVLATILSRCQMIRFRPVATEAIAQGLMERKGMEAGEAHVLAAYAQGAVGRAFRLADAPEVRAQRETLLDLANRIAHSPGIAAFKLAEDLRNLAKPPAAPKPKKGEATQASADAEESGDKTARGDITRAVDVLSAFFADLLAVALCGPQARLVHEERRAAFVEAAKRYRPEQIAENVETLFAFRRHLVHNANAQLATEVLMLKTNPAPGRIATFMSSVPQFFVTQNAINRDAVTLPPDAAHHARNVLRLAVGDALVVMDGTGNRFACRLTEVSPKVVRAVITEQGTATSEARTRITIAQALPKTSGQIEQVLQHGTEVGAAGFAFWAAQRSVARLADNEKIEKRLTRWNGIVQSAAEQSHRGVLPNVAWLPFAADVARALGAYDAALTLHESGVVPLVRSLASLPVSGALRLLVIVGPEGGLTNEEVARFETAGAQTVTLGPRVLRTETAALVALAQILYARESGEEPRTPDANPAA